MDCALQSASLKKGFEEKEEEEEDDGEEEEEKEEKEEGEEKNENNSWHSTLTEHKESEFRPEFTFCVLLL